MYFIICIQKLIFILYVFSLNGLIMNDIVEVGRRLKRSLDGYITYRKAGAIVVVVVVYFLYLGPGAVRWLLGRDQRLQLTPLQQCLKDKVGRFQGLVDGGNGHNGGH